MYLRISLLFLILSLFSYSCTRCDNEGFDLTVTYEGIVANEGPIFDRVYSLYGNRDLVQNGTLTSVPVDLSRDSTVLILEYENQVDTLAFGYERDLNAGGRNKGYCIEIKNPEILNINTFENTQVYFELENILSGIREYSLIIYL